MPVESPSPMRDVARTAREALARGDLDAARGHWRRLVRMEPTSVVWRLRAAEANPDGAARAAERAALYGEALEADAPLAALLAALADPLSDAPADLVSRLTPWLAGSPRLRGRTGPLPPVLQAGPVPPDADQPLPPWPKAGAGQALTPMPLLSLLDAEGLDRVLAACSRRSLAEGEVLLTEGDTADALYLLAGGALVVVKDDPSRGEIALGTLRPGAVVGEMALVLDRPRNATVKASEEAELLRIGLDALRTAAAAAPGVAAALASFTESRALATLLGTSPLFADLEPAARALLARRFGERDALADEVLLQEGEPAAGLFLVVEGAVEVTRHDGGRPALVARLGPGQVFGEIALLHGGPAQATVVAQTDCRLRVLSAAAFEAVCVEHPAVRAAAEALAEARVAENRFIFEDDEFIEAAD